MTEEEGNDFHSRFTFSKDIQNFVAKDVDFVVEAIV